jgi:serine/threonine-protein kinase
MEFVDAGTLTDRLGLPMSSDQAVKIMDQIASALDYAHMQGLVHRDVKPSNILLPKPDWPLLTDFGLAKIVGGSQLTLTGTIAGTPAYMSPEQGQGESVDSRSDIYSLGIVLYEMMTGAVPYHAETPMAVVVKHIIEPLPLPTTKNPSISENIERVILKALAKDPADRYQRATDLAKAFRDAVGAPAPSHPSDRPTVLDDATPEPVVETVVDPYQPGEPVLESTPSVDHVVAEAPPPISIPEEIPQVESVPEFVPDKQKKPTKGLMEQRPWLKFALPAGAAAVALCAIGMLIAFVVIPNITDNLGNGSEIPATMTVDEHILEGHMAFEAEEYETAILAYETAISQGSEDVDTFFSLASSYNEVGRLEEALSTLDRVLRLYAEEPNVRILAGNFYQSLGYDFEAITQYEQALELNPDDRSFLEDLAQSYRAVGEYAKAEEVLSQGEQPKRDDDEAYEFESQGWDHLYNDDLAKAEEAFQKALEINPNLVSSWEGLAEVYWYRGDFDAAIEILHRGIEANPESAILYEQLGWISYYAGDYGTAEWAFNNAIQYDSNASTAWEGLADVYWDLGDLTMAIEVLNTAIELDPSYEYYYEKLGMIHYDNSNIDAAIEAFETSISMAPEYSTAYRSLADLWLELGDESKAVEVMQRGVEANPNRSDVLEGLGYLYLDLGYYNESVETFKAAIQIDPEYGWLYAGLAQAYLELGNVEATIEALNNADLYSYEDPWLWESIGWTYISMDDCESAINYFNRTLEVEPFSESAQQGLEYCSE